MWIVENKEKLRGKNSGRLRRRIEMWNRGGVRKKRRGILGKTKGRRKGKRE